MNQPIADKAFIDSNLVVYLYTSTEPLKRSAVMTIFDRVERPLVSNQVLAEVSNVLRRHFKLAYNDILCVIDEIATNCETVTYTGGTVQTALRLCDKHQLSFFDSLLLATARENNCSVFYTEDVQGIPALGEMQIINPLPEQDA